MRKKLSFFRQGLPIVLLFCLVLCGCGIDKNTIEIPALSSYSTSGGNSRSSREADLLTLVNPWNSLDKYYNPILANYTEEHRLDRRAMDDFVDMIRACREGGGDPYIVSAYRNNYEQTQLYEAKIRRLIKAGIDPSIAPTEAAKSVAVPGTSEHQLGLAVDLVDANYGYLNEYQAETPTQQWLMENSWRFGFILRYPVDKSEITGIIYEPWHYRYVGKENAKDIYESGLCLEEWLEARAAEEVAIQSRHPKSMANKWENYPERA